MNLTLTCITIGTLAQQGGYVPKGIANINVGKSGLCAYELGDQITAREIQARLGAKRFGFEDQNDLEVMGYVETTKLAEARRIVAKDKSLRGFVQLAGDQRPLLTKSFGSRFRRHEGRDDEAATLAELSRFYARSGVREENTVWQLRRTYGPADAKRVGGDFIVEVVRGGITEYDWLQRSTAHSPLRYVFKRLPDRPLGLPL